ncbi:hypothetical protein ACFQT0_06190 [Hymenobacter humi]|uniref:Uncharacterized protein n=1 Tax=Hymenobacter humi TaxID=1411620 RepID=A0ABW2U3Z4_9BACT
MLIYAAGDWQPNRPGARALQGPPLVAAYLFMFGLATFGETDTYANVLRPPLLPYLVALGAVLALSVAGKRVRGRYDTLLDWLLLLPGFYLPGGLPLAVATLVVLYAHAGSVLARAHRHEDPDQLTIGAVLFVIATMVAYFKLTWAFLDKSLFFLLGGVLLLGLSLVPASAQCPGAGYQRYAARASETRAPGQFHPPSLTYSNSPCVTC